jgi:signal transduction histidine kinase
MTVGASAIAALVCLGVSAIILAGVRGQAADYQKEKVAQAALKIVYLVKKNQLPAVPPKDAAAAIQVLDAAGRPVAAAGPLVGQPPFTHFQPPASAVTGQRVFCHVRGFDGCVFVVAFRVYQPDGDWTVYALGHTVPWYTSGTLLWILLGVSGLLVVLTALGTSRTVSKTLAPVAAIRTELAEITAKDLDRRVPVPRNRDEIALLAETANATLDRLEAAMERLRRFTSDASHDLRSPITAARTQVEEALLHPGDTDWPRTARAILAGLDRLQAIVEDLLMLSRLDAQAPQTWEELDLGRLVAAELERRPRGKRVVARLQPDVQVTGDPQRLGRLLTNLVDNAERHAVREVTITVHADGDLAVLEVLDDGAGIDPDQREVVFQRFTRLDAARSRDAGGTGLGLPIARQIAEAHGGALEIEDSGQGARFVLRLPLRRQEKAQSLSPR